jgi:hypothetical protein
MNCPHCSKEVENTIPKSELIEERRLRQAAETRGALAERHATENAELKTQLAGKDVAHGRDIHLLGSGLKDIADPQVRSAFLQAYEGQTAIEGGEADLGKYIDALKADPTKAPILLRAFVPVAGQQQAAPGQPAPRLGTDGKPLPDPNKGARPVNGAPPPVTPESVKAMSNQDLLKQLPAMAQSNPELAGASRFAGILERAGQSGQRSP